MGLLLLLSALVVFAGVVALGVWGMVRMDAPMGGHPDSVLSQWVTERQAPPSR